jgi:mycoredoxin
MADATILIYATEWCWDCKRARRYFEKNQIPFRWIDIDKDHEAEAFVINCNQGNRSVPTIVFPDGSRLVEPSNQQLDAKLRS